MDRKITVKGIGHISAKPDYVIINMTVDATSRKYEQAVKEASEKIDRLSASLSSVGFEKDALKTADFRTDIARSFKKNLKGISEMVNTGFICTNRMKLEFDFDSERLSKAIDAITNCVSDPRLNITFTVKDEEAVKDELLKSAGANAKRRAKILCEAAGGKLGDLISVDYNWNEISIMSQTRVGRSLGDTAELGECVPLSAPQFIQPEDIDLRDNAVFVWEIV